MLKFMKKKGAALLAAVICLVTALSAGISALGPLDTGRECELTVEFKPEGMIAADVPFRIYKVAAVDRYCTFTAAPDFADYGSSFTEMNAGRWSDLASTLAGCVLSEGIEPLAAEKTGFDGRFTVAPLQTAMYLVVGDPVTIGEYTYKPLPFLISMPTYDASFEWSYKQLAKVKYESVFTPTGKTVTRKVLKVWENDTEAVRPKSVSVTLLKNGAPYDTVELNAGNNWRFVWDKLDGKCDWKLIENSTPAGYKRGLVTSQGITFVVTNTYSTTPEAAKTAVTVVKKWENDTEKDRPKEIGVTLLMDGVPFETVKLNKKNNWQYVWTKMKADAKYTVREEDTPASYTSHAVLNGSAGSGYVFTLVNTKRADEPETVSYTVRKRWENDSASVRPADIEVELLGNGTPCESVRLSDTNGWTYTWTELDKDTTWSVREKKIPAGYGEPKYEYEDGTVTIVNTYDKEPEKTFVTVEKRWEDDTASVRPTSVTVELLKNKSRAATVTLNASNNWRYTWTDLDPSVEWTVNEVGTPKDYESVVITREDGVHVIVNSYVKPKPDEEDDPDTSKISVSVNKRWAGDNDAKVRPASVKVELLCDGAVFKTAELNKENGWKYTWTGLNKYATWEIREAELPENYTAHTDFDSETNTFTLTNTYHNPYVKLDVEKQWQGDEEAKRPASIVIALLKNGEQVETVTLNAENSWKHVWTDLDKNAEWSVSEPDVPKNYKADIERKDNSFTVTNTYTEPEKIKVSVTKEWKGDKEDKRPAGVEIELLKDGEVSDTVTLNAENEWKHTFEELDAEYKWTVREKEVPKGYTASVTGEDNHFIVTNTYEEPEKTKVSVKKVWQGDEEDKRPTSVVIELLKDGETSDTVTLSAENEWQHTFEELDAEYQWTVREQSIPEGYKADVSGENNEYTVTNTALEPDKTSVTVRKVWRGDKSKDRPESVEIALLKDGETFDTVTLDADAGWEYTWDELDAEPKWSVKELLVPDGYEASVTKDGAVYTVTNRYENPEEPPENPPEEPDDRPKHSTTSRTVVKKWAGDDDSEVRPTSVTVVLLGDGEEYSTATLNPANGWRYTWSELDKSVTWEIEEADIPEDYSVSTSVDGKTFTMTNTYHKPPEEPPEDEPPEDEPPEDEPPEEEEIIELDENGVPRGNWVPSEEDEEIYIELDDEGVPTGRMYNVTTGELTVEEPHEPRLPQTGMLWWPVPVLACAGLVFLIAGWIMLRRARKDGE